MRSKKSHLNFPMHRVERIESRNEPAHHEGCETGHNQCALARRGGDLRRACLEKTQRLTDAREKSHTRLRELDAAIAAAEKGYAQLRFQRLDLPADRAVREMQFAGSFGKAQAIGRDLEGRKRFERRQATAHRGLLI
jgi:hypothetical protein